MEQLMEQYRQQLIKQCEEGMEGNNKIKVIEINMYMTNKCNLYCTMCPFISKDYSNKTYFNKEPYFATLKDVKKILFNKKVSGKRHEYVKFNFFMGETLLNPEIFKICKYIKKKYVNSEIVILSNGTIPPANEEIVKYIDILGFSLDGGTKEVFEAIRTPAKFEHVVNTIHKWVKARNKYNINLKFRTSTTLSTLNFMDLPNIVRTVGEVVRTEGGDWDSIYCQPVVIEDYQRPELRKITLEYVDRLMGKKVLEETERLAAEYSIRLDMPQVIYEMFYHETKIDKKDEQGGVERRCFCEKLSNGYLSYGMNGKLEFACCFMDKKYWYELFERYQIPDNKNPEEIYNSRGYWQLRKDLLEGKLQKECHNCTIGESNYYNILEELRRKNDAGSE